MKKGNIYEGIIEKVEFPNKGTMAVNDERVVIKSTVSGQKIQYVVTKRGKGKPEARTLEILERSPLELPDNECPHFSLCGEYIYQSLPYEEQLKVKEGQVRSLLDSVVEPETHEFQGIRASPAVKGY